MAAAHCRRWGRGVGAGAGPCRGGGGAEWTRQSSEGLTGGQDRAKVPTGAPRKSEGPRAESRGSAVHAERGCGVRPRTGAGRRGSRDGRTRTWQDAGRKVAPLRPGAASCRGGARPAAAQYRSVPAEGPLTALGTRGRGCAGGVGGGMRVSAEAGRRQDIAQTGKRPRGSRTRPSSHGSPTQDSNVRCTEKPTPQITTQRRHLTRTLQEKLFGQFRRKQDRSKLHGPPSQSPQRLEGRATGQRQGTQELCSHQVKLT